MLNCYTINTMLKCSVLQFTFYIKILSAVFIAIKWLLLLAFLLGISFVHLLLNYFHDALPVIQHLKEKERTITVEPRHPVNTVTLLLRLLYSGPEKSSVSHFFIYLQNPFNIATPLMRPDFCGPLVTGLTGFHCSFETKSSFMNGNQQYSRQCLFSRAQKKFLRSKVWERVKHSVLMR